MFASWTFVGAKTLVDNNATSEVVTGIVLSSILDAGYNDGMNNRHPPPTMTVLPVIVDPFSCSVGLVLPPGCDASVLLDDTSSFTDILAVAARDSVVAIFIFVLFGGPSWTVQLGRRDSTTASSSAVNTNIPSPLMDLNDLISNFAKKGFSAKEMVALSGAHTIGQARCLLFRERIYNETNIDSEFATSLKSNCPSSGGDDNLSQLDATSSVLFDNGYFQDLVNNKDFANAMVKMGNLSPLTGTDGQICTNCRKIN
ncbi:peroxidase [Citrus sinensis]|nr:peroxidase [Citrus sinensis]